MPPNDDTSAAWAYHDGTKHSPESVRADRHGLDFANQPRPYKLYVHDEPIPLPSPTQTSPLRALDAIGATSLASGTRIPDVETLAGVLHYSAGITKHLRYPGGVMPFRAASCTGALYHIEIYVVCGDLHGLAAGVYHYGAHDHALRRLREGNFLGALGQATGGEPAVAHAPATLVYTSTFWRNAWKYQARAYRHTFWDSGTIVANTLAMASAHDLQASVVLGYADEEVNRLIAVDGHREAAVALIPLGWSATEPPSAERVPNLNLETVPVSPREIEYPAIGEFHRASCLATAAAAAAWRQTTAALPIADSHPPSEAIPLAPGSRSDDPTDPIETVINRRGSSRLFADTPITFADLSTMLMRADAGFASDFGLRGAATSSECYVIANAVDGLAPGTYVLDRGAALRPLRQGSFRREAGFLALTQELAATAAANLYFLTDLPPILGKLGNRGYRAAQLDAAVAGGRVYLTAYALGLGASGLTFFDDEVTTFFSPHASGKSVMFLVAVGTPARRSR